MFIVKWFDAGVQVGKISARHRDQPGCLPQFKDEVCGHVETGVEDAVRRRLPILPAASTFGQPFLPTRVGVEAATLVAVAAAASMTATPWAVIFKWIGFGRPSLGVSMVTRNLPFESLMIFR